MNIELLRKAVAESETNARVRRALLAVMDLPEVASPQRWPQFLTDIEVREAIEKGWNGE